MRMKLVEPLRELFKDEVRRLGVELGLPREMVYRHPFPGPGLGVRILGEVRKDYADLLRQADAIFIEELRRHDLYDKTSQAFAVFLPVRSVGVMGDGRRYDYVVALRAVETVDFMTAHWARLPYDFLDVVLAPHRERGEGHLARGLRHLGEAAGDDRVGVSRAKPALMANASGLQIVFPRSQRYQRRAEFHFGRGGSLEIAGAARRDEPSRPPWQSARILAEHPIRLWRL